MNSADWVPTLRLGYVRLPDGNFSESDLDRRLNTTLTTNESIETEYINTEYLESEDIELESTHHTLINIEIQIVGTETDDITDSTTTNSSRSCSTNSFS